MGAFPCAGCCIAIRIIRGGRYKGCPGLTSPSPLHLRHDASCAKLIATDSTPSLPLRPAVQRRHRTVRQKQVGGDRRCRRHGPARPVRSPACAPRHDQHPEMIPGGNGISNQGSRYRFICRNSGSDCSASNSSRVVTSETYSSGAELSAACCREKQEGGSKMKKVPAKNFSPRKRR